MKHAMLAPAPAPGPAAIRPGWKWYGVPWTAASAAVTLALAAGGPAARAVGFWTLVGSILLFGLPHGAADWWIMGRSARHGWNLRQQTKAAGAYVLAMVATLGFWWWQPGLALAGFLTLTAWHFGSADASVLLPERRTFHDPVWWIFAVGRGLLVVFTPLAFRPAEAVGVLDPFAALGPGVGPILGGLPRVALGLTWAGALLQLAAIQWDKRTRPGPVGRRRFTTAIVETAGLLMLFRVAPPLLAFVAYWVGFHAWRHVLRLEKAGVMGNPRGRPAGGMLWDFHRRTLPVTLLSLPGLALIFMEWPGLMNGPHAVVAYLLLLSVLTVPHAVIVGWLLDGEKRLDSFPNAL